MNDYFISILLLSFHIDTNTTALYEMIITALNDATVVKLLCNNCDA